MDRPYYSQRAGRAPSPARLDLRELKRLLATLLSALIEDGYLQEFLGYECVDTGFRAGTRGIDLRGELLLTLNKPHLLPFPSSVDDWSEDDLFDSIEFVYDILSKLLNATSTSGTIVGGTQPALIGLLGLRNIESGLFTLGSRRGCHCCGSRPGASASHSYSV
jgi:hypothetical protein